MIQGTKFELDLDDDEEEKKTTPLPAAFVGDILERKSTAAKPPSLPTLKNKNGFPEHKKRPMGESRFKSQKMAAKSNSPTGVVQVSHSREDHPPPPSTGNSSKTWEEEEKSRIDVENRRKLAEMSPEEIEEERRELMSSLGPALIEKLLKRANVADGSEEVDLSRPMGAEDDDAVEEKSHVLSLQATQVKPAKTVTFEEPSTPPAPSLDQNPPADDSTSQPQSHHDSIHFPQPPHPPSLDPSSTTFLTDLHTKYFPSLPSDPSKLEWMQPTTSSPSSYSPTATALSPSDIRFSFRGELIPPSLAATIPVTQGLHHHGDAPDSAGYTIPELAHLARSTYPAQRCIAFQTLGRVLYRLGKGEFGMPDGEAARRVGSEEEVEDDRGEKGELARGLWREVERLKVVEILVDESEGRGVDKGRHLSAKTYATEAVWLWRKGGGRRWKAE